MKNNNKKLYILVSVLLIGVGLTFAYFVGKTIFSGTGATTEARTATVNGSILDIEGELVLDNNMYPGHKTLSKITATATGDNEPILYNLIWEGINGLNTTLKYKVYRTEDKKEINITCTPKKKVINGEQHINEECDITGIEGLGKEINDGEIKTTVGEEQEIIILATNELITSKPEPGKTYYYYVIIEYPDTNVEQNKDLEHNFDGRVYGEISNSKADINIIGIHKENEEGKYDKTDKIPEREEGYTLNTIKSHCTKDATLNWNESDWSLEVNNLTQSGTDCELYFCELSPEKTVTQLGKRIEEGQTEFTGVDIEEHTGVVYSGTDDLGTTYYFRGRVKDNWVKFGKDKNNQDMYWRIIRINGNGSIRMIYTGSGRIVTDDEGYTSQGTQTNITNNEITETYYTYNDSDDKAEYVGFKYKQGEVRGKTDKSNALTQLEMWFKDNMLEEQSQLDTETGFCNDRTAYTGSTTGSSVASGVGSSGTQYFGSLLRNMPRNSSVSSSNPAKPIFTCPTNGDLFTVSGSLKGNKQLEYPVGLITIDEATFAGAAYGPQNTMFYLYTGQTYWTMSPCHFYPSNVYPAYVFRVSEDGYLYGTGVLGTSGVRPVINLNAAILFKAGGNGTSDNPYEVS